MDTAKLAFAQLHQKADRPTAISFLEALIEVIPYQLHTNSAQIPKLN